jgi:hypothetical protein
VSFGRVQELGCSGAYQICAPREEYSVENHDNPEWCHCEYEKSTGTADPAFISTIAWPYISQHVITRELGPQGCTNDDGRSHPTPKRIQKKPLAVLACKRQHQLIAFVT